MEDQFGGRTDDDLFYDDFEPVESETIIVQEPVQQIPEPEPSTAEAPAAPETAVTGQSKPRKPSPPAQQKTNDASSTPVPPPPKVKGGNLSSSRFARTSNVLMKQQSTPPPTESKPSAPVKDTKVKETRDKTKDREVKGKDASPPSNAPTAPAKEKKHQPSPQNTAAPVAQARLQSGANPRQKLTEDELAAKMEKMKVLSAEKARKFEQAEQDEKQHAAAYAKGMEEARKRKAEEAERRRRGEEDKRKLDDERAKNRERKLKAMGMKEGGWDEGKEATLEEESRKGFKGAHGGVRGTRRGGLDGSRYARQGDEQPDVDRFLEDRPPGQGRGRGRGGRGGGRGRGNGGRGGFEGSRKQNDGTASAPTLTTEEFPALPSDGNKKSTTTAAPLAYPPKAVPPPIPSLPTPPSGGKWDDEMEALDELKQQGGS